MTQGKKSFIDYSEQYKRPEWQKKSREIFERDNWTCQHCKSTTKQLQAHHKCYIPNVKVWEYDNELLISYCQPCHEKLGPLYKLYNSAILVELYRCGFNYLQMQLLATVFYRLGKIMKRNKFIFILNRFFTRMKDQDI